MQALHGSKLSAQSPMRLHIECEVASACQHCAASILATLPLSNDALKAATRAANLLRKALSIHERQLERSAAAPSGQGADRRRNDATSRLRWEDWHSVLAALQDWTLADSRRPVQERIVDLHLSLVQVVMLQLQCAAEDDSSRCEHARLQAVMFACATSRPANHLLQVIVCLARVQLCQSSSWRLGRCIKSLRAQACRTAGQLGRRACAQGDARPVATATCSRSPD